MSIAMRASITITLFCFAQLRDHIADAETAVALPSGATGRALLERLKRQCPRMGPLLDVSRLAVNCEYVSAGVELHDGDEVAVIPPVSGG